VIAQLHLFEVRQPFQVASPTSAAAAVSVRETAGTVRARCLAFIRARGPWGATRDEIARGCGIRIQTVCARVDELLKVGAVRRTSRTRVTDTGRAAEVVEIVP
jgi:predicted transcriptional regulator